MKKSVQFTYIEQPSFEIFERQLHIIMHRDNFIGYRYMGDGDYTLILTEEKTKIKIDLTLDINGSISLRTE